MKTKLTTLLILIAASLSAADKPRLAKTQSLSVDAPVSGYAAFGASEIRALIGLPGLLRWSEPLAIAGSYNKLAIAPGELYALGINSKRQAVVLRLNALDTAAIAQLDTDLESVDSILFSPLGSAAVLQSSTGRALVITGLPEAPAISRSFDSSGSVIALSDDAQLYVVRDASGNGSLRDQDGGTAAQFAGLKAAAFFARSQRLLAVSGDGAVLSVEGGAVQGLLESAYLASARELMVGDSGLSAHVATVERLWTVDIQSAALKAELVEPKSAVLHRTRVRGRLLLVDDNSGEAQLVSNGVDSMQVDSLRSPVALLGN
jgi:hypothetical protein